MKHIKTVIILISCFQLSYVSAQENYIGLDDDLQEVRDNPLYGDARTRMSTGDVEAAGEDPIKVKAIFTPVEADHIHTQGYLATLNLILLAFIANSLLATCRTKTFDVMIAAIAAIIYLAAVVKRINAFNDLKYEVVEIDTDPRSGEPNYNITEISTDKDGNSIRTVKKNPTNGNLKEECKIKGNCLDQLRQTYVDARNVANENLKEDYRSQRAYLEQLRQTYVDARDVADDTSALEVAAAAGFAGAMVVAMLDREKNITKLSACAGAIEAARDGMRACYGVDAAAPLCAICSKSLNTADATLLAVEERDKHLQNSSIHTTEQKTKADAAVKDISKSCGNPMLTIYKGPAAVETCEDWNSTYTSSLTLCETGPDVMGGDLTPLIQKESGQNTVSFNDSKSSTLIYIKGIIKNLLFNNSYALDPTIIGLSGVGVGIVQGIRGKSFEFVDRLVSTASKRAALWGLLSMLAFVSAELSTKNAEVMDENIRRIDEILALLDEKASGEEPIQAAKKPIIDGNAQFTVPGLLPQTKKGEPSYANGGLNCVTGKVDENGVCIPLEDLAKENELVSKLGPGFFKNLGDLATLSVKGDVGSKALSHAKNLANMMKDIDASRKEIEGNINKIHEQMGLEKVDFRKESTNILKEFQKEVFDKMPEENMLDLSKIPYATSLTPSSSELTQKTTDSSLKYEEGSGAGLNAKDVPLSILDLFKEDQGSVDYTERLPSGEYLNYMPLERSTGRSIFKIISERYMKSAYPRLLEKK